MAANNHDDPHGPWVADINNGSPIIGKGREEITTVTKFNHFSSGLSDGTLPLHYERVPIVHL